MKESSRKFLKMYSLTVAAATFCGLMIFMIRAPEIFGCLDQYDGDDHTFTLSKLNEENKKCNDAEKVCEQDDGAHLKIMDPEAEERVKGLCAGKNYTCTPGIGCHKLFEFDKTWDEARDACERDGAHLAIINSESEEQHLVKMLRESRSFSAWIGVHYEDKTWLTVNGEPISSAGYIHWYVDSNYDKNTPVDGPTLDVDHMCVEFTTASTRSGMNYVYCDYQVSYICEREIQY